MNGNAEFIYQQRLRVLDGVENQELLNYLLWQDAQLQKVKLICLSHKMMQLKVALEKKVVVEKKPLNFNQKFCGQ